MAGATHTATLLKTPMGFGITLTADNVIKGVAKGSQAARDGHFKVGDQVCSLNETPLSPEVTLSSVLAEFSNGEHVVFGLHCRESLSDPWTDTRPLAECAKCSRAAAAAAHLAGAAASHAPVR